MPKIKRTTRFCPSQPFGDGLSSLERFRPIHRFVDQRPIFQVFFNVAYYFAGIGHFDQATIGALAHGGAQFQAMQRSEQDGLSVAARPITQGCGGVVIGNVQRHQARGVQVCLQRRNCVRTSAMPGIGFGEMRLSRALKAAEDLPGRCLRTGTSLIQGLPPCVTTTVSPAWAKSPNVSNPCIACRLVTVLIPQTYRRVNLSAMAKSFAALQWQIGAVWPRLTSILP